MTRSCVLTPCALPSGSTPRHYVTGAALEAWRRLPIGIYVHPTHGFLFETWTTQNEAMLRLLASRGVVVLSPVRVGDPLGVGPAAPIVGGLMPGGAVTLVCRSCAGSWRPSVCVCVFLFF